MNNDYENLVKYLMTRKGYSKSEARGEAWKCIAKKALKNELARNDVDSDEWMSTEELSEFGLTRQGWDMKHIKEMLPLLFELTIYGAFIALILTTAICGAVTLLQSMM